MDKELRQLQELAESLQKQRQVRSVNVTLFVAFPAAAPAPVAL